MPGAIYTPAGYGSSRIDSTKVLDVPAHTIVDSERYRRLDRRESYFECTQHDWKAHDFDGRVIMQQPGWPTSMPMLSSDPPAGYIPLRMRRPNSPVRIGRRIVKAFSALVFGEGRFPDIEVLMDEETRAFDLAIIEAGELPMTMLEARNRGGSAGSVAISWSIKKGEPRFVVHRTKHLHVSEWEDRDALIPAYVTEMYRYPESVWDAEKRQYLKKMFWWRRDWTPTTDIIYLPVEWKLGEQPIFAIDLQRSVNHDSGECHVVWIQNTPSDEIDGDPDYETLEDGMDSLDLLSSVTTRGTTANLDPTLVLKVDPGMLNHGGVKKGTENALAVGPDGDAAYLELAGTAAKAGVDLMGDSRRDMLETAQCVIPDPDEIASQGVSAVSLKVIYRPMLAQASVLQTQYGRGIKRLLLQIRGAARLAGVGSPRSLPKALPGLPPSGVAEVVEDPFPTIVVPVLNLPPRVIEEEAIDAVTQEPTGEKRQRLVPQTPGKSDLLRLKWPPFFDNTMKDYNDAAMALTTATGGKAIISKQTATEMMATVLGKDPGEEWLRASAAEQQDMAHEKELAGMGDLGAGNPDDPDAPPGKGASPFGKKPGGGSPFGKKPGGNPFGKGKPNAAEEDGE